MWKMLLKGRVFQIGFVVIQLTAGVPQLPHHLAEGRFLTRAAHHDFVDLAEADVAKIDRCADGGNK